jgi:hypothetical protein
MIKLEKENETYYRITLDEEGNEQQREQITLDDLIKSLK